MLNINNLPQVPEKLTDYTMRRFMERYNIYEIQEAAVIERHLRREDHMRYKTGEDKPWRTLAFDARDIVNMSRKELVRRALFLASIRAQDAEYKIVKPKKRRTK